MAFSYWDYIINNLMLPVFGLVFIAVPTFQLVRRVIEQLATGRQRVDWDGKAIVFFVVMVVIAVLLGKSLFADGGIHLIYEREKAAVTVEGTLEDIEKCSALKGIRYTYENEASFGYEFTVDGVTATGMAVGTLEEGDQVVMTYLPKSGFVLSIEEVNP